MRYTIPITESIGIDYYISAQDIAKLKDIGPPAPRYTIPITESIGIDYYISAQDIAKLKDIGPPAPRYTIPITESIGIDYYISAQDIAKLKDIGPPAPRYVVNKTRRIGFKGPPVVRERLRFPKLRQLGHNVSSMIWLGRQSKQYRKVRRMRLQAILREDRNDKRLARRIRHAMGRTREHVTRG